MSLSTFTQDLRYGFRIFAKNPGFSAVIVLTLALGIGANTAIFTLADHVLLRPLPVRNPGELMFISGTFSYPRFEQIRDRNTVFSSIFAAHSLGGLMIASSGQAESPVTGELVSGSYFSTFGIGAIIGRTVLPEDDLAAESSPVAVISYSYWQRAFGGTPDVLGKKIRARCGAGGWVNTAGLDIYDGAVRSSEGALLTIIGVAQPDFFGDTVGTATDMWIPLTMEPAVMPGRPWLKKSNVDWVAMMGRTKAGISREQACARMTELWREILTDEAGTNLSEDRKRTIAASVMKLESGKNGFNGVHNYYAKPLQILLAVVSSVLLIVCLNVANLLLARAGVRRHEFGVRLALGASRMRLIRQLLTENLWLGALGGACGSLIAFFGTKALVTLVSSGYEPIDLPIQTDFRMLGFTAAISLLAVVLFGLVPAFRATKISVGSALKEGSRTTVGARRVGLAKILVAAQIPISMVLLIGAGLFLRTLHNLRTQDVGYDPERLLVMRLDPVTGGYRGENIGRICKTILDRIAALPGVRTATLSENGLFFGPESSTMVDIDGSAAQSKWQDRVARFDQVGPGYFTRIGVPLLFGRDITDRDNVGAPRVAVINETMAKFYFPSGNPIGKHLRTGQGGQMQKFDLEIVGVARDVQDHNFWAEPVRRFYVSYFQPIDGITEANFELRTIGSPASVAAMLRKEVEAVDRNLLILGIREVQTLMNQSLVQERLVAKLSTFFSVLALTLAAIGLYGVIAHEVTQRTNEIGVRMALGAQRADVLKWILQKGIHLTLAGIFIGLTGAFAVTRLIKSVLYKVEVTDPATFAGVSLLLICVALIACWLPARRASKVDPMVALRYE